MDVENTNSELGRAVFRCDDNTNIYGRTPNSELGRAAFRGDIRGVENALNNGAGDVNHGMTRAAEGGHLHIFNIFIKLGATRLDAAMIAAARGQSYHIIDRIAGLGYKDVRFAMWNAHISKDKQMFDYLGYICSDFVDLESMMNTLSIGVQ